MNSFNSKVTNRKLNSQKQGGLHRDAADGSAGETGHKDSEGQDITTIDNDPTRTKGSTETYTDTHTQGRQGQLDTGETHEDWCRQSQTGSKERKHTRHRDYKIKQETEHGVKTWTPETSQTDKHRDVQETRGATNKLKTLIPKGGWKLHTGKGQTVTERYFQYIMEQWQVRWCPVGEPCVNVQHHSIINAPPPVVVVMHWGYIWDPISQTPSGGHLGCLWPHFFSAVWKQTSLGLHKQSL